MRIAFFVLAVAAMVSGGCINLMPADRRAAFDASEYEPYEVSGTGRITGQCYLVKASGVIVYGAGRKVFLDPVTRYSTEWYERTVLGGRRLEEVDPSARPVLDAAGRTTVADQDGRFVFEGLPPGDYYVTCVISSHPDDEDPRGEWLVVSTGVIAHARVTVGDNQTVAAVVRR